jgi:hypothetical protein
MIRRGSRASRGPRNADDHVPVAGGPRIAASRSIRAARKQSTIANTTIMVIEFH